jgi:translocation-and-assembly-module (TAM) inner membrane subunit TamB-like protein
VKPPEPPTPPAPEIHHPALHLSPLRLFLVLLVFLLLAGYAVWNSERFQNLFQGVSQTRISAALGRPVTFRRVDFRFLPPSVRLADVRIGNDPRVAGQPFLSADEVSIGGGVSLTGQELRLGRIRALHPKISLVQFPDGSWNLPPGLTAPSRQGGVKVRVGEVVLQQGLFDLDGRKTDIDVALEDFAGNLKSLGEDHYSGALTAQRMRLTLPDAEPIVSNLATRFHMEPGHGIVVESVRLAGSFGSLAAAGTIETGAAARTSFVASGDVSITEVERIFHSRLGFSGDAHVSARLDIPSGGEFQIAGNVTSPRVDAQGFLLENLEVSVDAGPDELVAHIDRGRYAGGEAQGVVRIASLASKPRVFTIALEGRGLSLERFFADLDLPGTGLAGAAELTIALRFPEEAGIEHANGGGTLEVRPGPASSIVPGRHGLSTGGGGPLSLVDGRIGFEGVVLRFPQTTVDLNGGLRIGHWQPDFDFDLTSKDLTEVDRLFQNIVAATGGKPEPLGLGGTGDANGHLGGAWGDPDATVQFSAEETRWAGVRFGSVRGTADVREGAFLFRPLRAYDGEASLSLEGTVRFREAPGRPKLELEVAAHEYPLERFLDYLDLDFPVAGLVTGSFPIAGSTESLTGGGPIRVSRATLWGQQLEVVTGRVLFSPGRFELADVRTELGGGVIGGSGALDIDDKTFVARFAGDAVDLPAIAALKDYSDRVSGKLSFQVSGSGKIDRPDLTATASLAEATLFGHRVPEGAEPRLDAKIVSGELTGSVSVPNRWSVSAQGNVFDPGSRVSVALDARDLAALLLFTPLDVAPGRGGALAVRGVLTLPSKAGEFVSGVFTVTEARLDFPDRPGILRTSGDVKIVLARQKLVFDEFHALGEGTDLKVQGSIDLGARNALALTVAGPVDASLVALALPGGAALTGRITLDVAASGTVDVPALSGTVRIENGKYRLTGLTQILDDIDGVISFHGSRAEIDGIRAHVGGGDLFAAGNVNLKGLTLDNFRLTIQARHVALRYPEGMRLVVDADLVATGVPGGNVVRGEVTLLRGTYSRDFGVTVADLLERNRPSGSIAAREPWKEETVLEVRIVSAAALEVRNNVARLTAEVDLVARGTVAQPIVLGQIIFDEGGRITFRDVQYEIESGTVTFANTARIAPIIDLRARAEVKGYDLVVNLVGTWPRIQSTFTSDPPLSDDAVIGLLLTGAEPGRRTATDTTESLVSAAGGIVAGAVAGGLTRGTQRLFRLDRFQIDPVFSGSQLTDIRSTVGKQITPELLVTYSQSLNSDKESVVQLEWRVGQQITLQALRDENGVYSINVRRRQRF